MLSSPLGADGPLEARLELVAVARALGQQYEHSVVQRHPVGLLLEGSYVAARPRGRAVSDTFVRRDRGLRRFPDWSPHLESS
jgi:hypothetical protein